MEDKNYDYCMYCVNWKYNQHIENKYGEGTGICELSGDPKGCNRTACLCFRPKNIEELMKKEGFKYE